MELSDRETIIMAELYEGFAGIFDNVKVLYSRNIMLNDIEEVIAYYIKAEYLGDNITLSLRGSHLDVYYESGCLKERIFEKAKDAMQAVKQKGIIVRPVKLSNPQELNKIKYKCD